MAAAVCGVARGFSRNGAWVLAVAMLCLLEKAGADAGTWTSVSANSKYVTLCQLASASCATGWRSSASTSKCFRATPSRVTHAEAAAACKDLNSAATIAVITKQAENDAAADACPASELCYIGLIRTCTGADSCGRWEWSDGTELYDVNGEQKQDVFVNWAADVNHNRGETVAVLDNASEDEESAIELRMARVVKAARLLGLVMLFSLPVSIVGQIIAFWYAHSERSKMLEEARQGKPSAGPTFCWRYACGTSAIYYWEGCSTNVLLSVVCCCYSCVCWTPGPEPLVHGQPLRLKPGVQLGAPVEVQSLQ